MSKRLEFWGALGTCFYLLAIGAKVFYRLQELQELPLNELGDFLAGVFGPVAFLWLVLGVLQQGRELKLSTDALQLQAEELKNSVEQQTRMADAAVRQIDSAMQALELQLQSAERAVTADFEVRPTLKTGGLKGLLNKVTITNYRNVAYKVTSEFLGNLPFSGLASHGTLKEGDAVEMALDFPAVTDDHHGELHLTYEDLNGVLRIEVFQVTVGWDSWVKFEKRRDKSARLVRERIV